MRFGLFQNGLRGIKIVDEIRNGLRLFAFTALAASSQDERPKNNTYQRFFHHFSP